MTLIEQVARDCASQYDAEFEGGKQEAEGVMLFFKKGEIRYKVHVSCLGDEQAVAERIGWTLQ